MDARGEPGIILCLCCFVVWEGDREGLNHANLCPKIVENKDRRPLPGVGAAARGTRIEKDDGRGAREKRG